MRRIVEVTRYSVLGTHCQDRVPAMPSRSLSLSERWREGPGDPENAAIPSASRRAECEAYTRGCAGAGSQHMAFVARVARGRIPATSFRLEEIKDICAIVMEMHVLLYRFPAASE